FDLQYDSRDIFATPVQFGEFFEDYKPTDVQFLSGSGKWKKARFTADDCRFAGKMNGGADLRIRNMTGTIYVASVKLIQENLVTSPAANVTVLVGNDRQMTDEKGELTYTFAPEDPAGVYRIEALTENRDLLPTDGKLLLEE
ncbi:MAG: hypothetical protein IJT95_01570, partial [Abditibacteriota bacterium]|nr:hypothetical protein [Abditibacteriota bacterium]